jgi:hypothetical protein
MNREINAELLKRALIATDEYLGMYKDAVKKGYASAQDVHDFTAKLSIAMEALKRFDDLQNHNIYIEDTIAKMAQLFRDEDVSLFDEPFTHVPGASGEAESVEIEGNHLSEDLRNWFDPKHPKGGWKRINTKGEIVGPCAREKGEPKPKCMSNEKISSLSKSERAAAVRAKRKHDPNPERKGEPINVSNYGKGKLGEEVKQLDVKNIPTNPELWSKAKALAKSKFDIYPSAYANGWASKWYKSKGGGWKTVSEEIDENDIDINDLEWNDIADTYEPEDFIVEEILDEKISAASRLRKRMHFKRTSSKRQIGAAIKLSRPSTIAQLQKRAKVAARRLLMKKFLHGRDKSTLSAQEKDVLEARVKALKNVQSVLAQRLIPKIRDIESKRLKSKRS